MLPYLLIIFAFVADRLTKWWAEGYLSENGVTQVNDYLSLYPTYNRGIAFGMFQGVGPLVGWLSLIVVFGLLIYLTRIPRSMWLLRIGIALIIGGALGNLVDRVIAGEVLDFIQTPIRPGIFNVADIMINVGVVLSLLAVLFQKEKSETDSQELELDEKVSP
jgi:signal peptidase II